jgi:ankyrin repeat protein
MWAAIHGTREVVEILCNLGADINARDKKGKRR